MFASFRVTRSLVAPHKSAYTLANYLPRLRDTAQIFDILLFRKWRIYPHCIYHACVIALDMDADLTILSEARQIMQAYNADVLCLL